MKYVDNLVIEEINNYRKTTACLISVTIALLSTLASATFIHSFNLCRKLLGVYIRSEEIVLLMSAPIYTIFFNLNFVT